MVKNWKRIIGFLCSVVFCTAIAVGMPQMVKAAEEVAINKTNFPDETFRDYVSSQFDINKNGKLSEEEITEVTEIDVYESEIGSLKGVEYFTALTILDCQRNQLTSLDVSKNMALTVLKCSYNQLTSLGVSKNTALTELECSCNQLTNIDVNKNTALTDLKCSYNQLTTLDVSKNMTLTELECLHNQLISLDVSKNTALTIFSCYFNQLTALDVSKNTALTIFSCSSNQLTSLDVSKNTALTELWCHSNQLASLDVSKNTALTILECHSNQLTSLDVSKNMALTELECFSNQLTTLDVSKNTTLAKLMCQRNQLTILDVSKSTALTKLECFSNQLVELKLHGQTYDKLSLYKHSLHGLNTILSDLQNVTVNDTFNTVKVNDITKHGTYKVDGKDFTIIYVDTVILPTQTPTPTSNPSVTSSPTPSFSPVVTSDAHIFSDYDYSNPVTGSAVVIYGNGATKTIGGRKVNNKALTLYTDILASYKHTPNSNGTVKSSVGKVIVGLTKTTDKPTVSTRNKITDTSASNIAKARIKNGQITVTAVGKECGLVYLWVIDTGTKGVSACCLIDVKLAPKKLEVQSTTGTKLTNTKLQNGTTLDVHVSGISGSVKTEDCTYTATVDSKYQSYVQIVPKGTTGQDFTITAKGIKNNKDTKVAITFTCDQNGKKVKFSLTITK